MLEELLEVDVDVRRLEPDGVSARLDELIGRIMSLRVEYGSKGAGRDGEAVRDAARILARPERLHQHVARRGAAASGHEDLEEVARLLRLPLLPADGPAVAFDRKPSESRDADGRAGTARRRRKDGRQERRVCLRTQPAQPLRGLLCA